MIKRIKILLTNSKLRYVCVGGSVYIFELVVIYIALKLHASQLLAVACSFWLGLLVSFALQKVITFQDKRVGASILAPQFLAMSLLVLFNFGFTLILTRLLNQHLPAYVIRTLAIGITTLWNFYIYRNHIFKSKDVVLID
jgi:putative flippase GtrA